MKETDIQKQILDWLAMQGHLAVRINTQGVPIWAQGPSGNFDTFSGFRPSPNRGTSDILCCMKGTGRFLAIEVKAGKGKPTPEQEKFLTEVTDRGGIGTVVWSLEELIADLEKMGL